MSVVKIKEFKAKNEEELLDLVTLWPKFDEEWHKGGEWIEPKDKAHFGNVASSEYQGRWNLNVNRFSVIEEIKPMPFNTSPPLIVPGRSVELRDYAKPYSIDPIKGTITTLQSRERWSRCRSGLWGERAQRS